jgi:hypothetical protein
MEQDKSIGETKSLDEMIKKMKKSLPKIFIDDFKFDSQELGLPFPEKVFNEIINEANEKGIHPWSVIQRKLEQETGLRVEIDRLRMLMKRAVNPLLEDMGSLLQNAKVIHDKWRTKT